jgi:hypothetical protein
MDWAPVCLTPSLRPVKAQNLSHQAADTSAVAEVVQSLEARMKTLETGQQTLIEAMARLSDLLERNIAGSEVPSRPEESANAAAQDDQRMAQIREKLQRQSIRLVG